MGDLMKYLEPRGVRGFTVRIGFVICMITAGHLGFALVFADGLLHDPSFYMMQALAVGGPFVGFFFFATAYQMRRLRQLSVLSRKDGLTGLNNRRTFLQMTERRQKSASTGVLLLLDADKFKRINDTYGHSVGDECLRSIAYRLQRNVRDDDVVGRLGGEEFAIFLAGTTTSQGRIIGERLTQPIPFDGGPGCEHLSVTLSIGAVMVCEDKSLDHLLMRADEALYEAKDLGRARLVFWDDTADQRADHMASVAAQRMN